MSELDLAALAASMTAELKKDFKEWKVERRPNKDGKLEDVKVPAGKLSNLDTAKKCIATAIRLAEEISRKLEALEFGSSWGSLNEEILRAQVETDQVDLFIAHGG